MVPNSPAVALGSHAPGVRDLIVEVVRSRHDRSAEAHQVAETRYTAAFASQWRDLLDDVHEALKTRGFESHKLTPGGYSIPIVNGCLVFAWRVPDSVDAVSRFASSPTRKSGFTAPPPDPGLFDEEFTDDRPVGDASEGQGFEHLVQAAGDPMPLVLVMVHSSPQQLQSITWAIATLDDDGTVTPHGEEPIWEPEPSVDEATSHGESFDSGEPVPPAVEPQKQEGPQPDA